MHLFKMLTRQHERMTIADGANIEKSDNNLVLIDFGRWYLAGCYLAENALLSAHSSVPHRTLNK